MIRLLKNRMGRLTPAKQFLANAFLSKWLAAKTAVSGLAPGMMQRLRPLSPKFLKERMVSSKPFDYLPFKYLPFKYRTAEEGQIDGQIDDYQLEAIAVTDELPGDRVVTLPVRFLRSQGLWGSPGARESSYWAESSAPAETLWKMVTNLADLAAWHPWITATNAPRGQQAKPGLIYRAFGRYLPLSTQVFVERVQPGELLSIRLFPFPGLQERVTYRIVSTTLCGTCVLYSMTLSGWLSPLAWPMMKPQATKVAAALVQAAEDADFHANAALYSVRDIF